MKATLSTIAIAAAVCVSALSVTANAGVANRYVEDFTTTQFKDPVNTTAHWENGLGTLGMYPFGVSVVGNYSTPAAMDAAMDGHYAFVADSVMGVVVLDVSDPALPAFVNVVATPGSAIDIAVSGRRAFVADGSNGLRIVDIDDPATPTLMGGYVDVSMLITTGVAAHGEYVFVTAEPAGLVVIDVSNPWAPTRVGSAATAGVATDLDTWGMIACVADGDSGLVLVDVTDPAAPAVVGRYDTPGTALDVSVSGDVAYVADGVNGLVTIDVNDSANPTLLGGLALLGTAKGVTATGDLAYVAGGAGGVHMIDITAPAGPILSATVPTAGDAAGVSMYGAIAMVASGSGGLQVVRFGSRHVPFEIAGSANSNDYARDLAIDGNHAYVADRYAGLHVFNISDPSSPVSVGSYATTGWRVDVDGQYAYLGGDGEGLAIIDISDPSNPAEVGRFAGESPGGDIRCAKVSGYYAYMAGREPKDFRIADIRDPSNPVEVGWVSIGPLVVNLKIWDLVVSGDYVYASAIHGNRGIYIIDVSDRSNPFVAGTYLAGVDSTFYAIAASGRYIYTQMRDWFTDNYLQVLSVEDPTNPVLIGSYSTPFGAQYSSGLADVTGDRLILPRHEYFDISDPTAVALEGFSPGRWEGGDIGGDHLFMAGGSFNGGDNFGVRQIYQRNYITEASDARSLVVHHSDTQIVRFRMATAQRDSIRWELTADGGANWQHVHSGPEWYTVDHPGSDLMWRSSHVLFDVDTNPACDSLEIEWLSENAVIESIEAVPGGDGDWVRVVFFRSAYDETAAADPIATYEVRRVSDDAVLMTVFAQQIDRYAARVPAPGWPSTESFYVAAYTAGGTRYDSPSEGATSVIVVGAEDEPVTNAYALYQNTPNPFNPTTAIGYDVAAGGGAVTLEIFDVSGRLVRTLVDGEQTEGPKRALWDGRNDSGNRVASGVYIYRLRAQGFVESRKMTLVQ